MNDSDNNFQSILSEEIKQPLPIKWIILGFILLSSTIGVGAYHVGRQSVHNNNQTPYPSLSPVIIQSTTTPTSIPSVPVDKECFKNTDCGPLNCIQAPCPSIQCINNKCVTVQPSTTQSTNKCNSDVDCPIIGGAGANCQDPNNCNLSVVFAQCINGYCDGYTSWPIRKNLFRRTGTK